MRSKLFSAAIALSLIFAASAVVRAADIDDAKAAVKKLADAPNYTWTTSIQGGFGNQQPVDYKTEKGGYTTFTFTPQGGDAMDVVLKGDKGVAKAVDGWKSQAELQKAADDAGGFSPEMIVLIRIGNFTSPATQAAALLEKATNVKKEGDTISADLAPASAKDLLTFKMPAGMANTFTMTSKEEKGTIKLTLKDGSVTKVEVHLTGTRTFNDQDNPVDQTTTMAIKDVGTTKVTVPEDAKKKLEAAATASAPATAPKP